MQTYHRHRMTIPRGAACTRLCADLMTTCRPHQRDVTPNRNRGSEDLTMTPRGGTDPKAQTKMADVVEWWYLLG